MIYGTQAKEYKISLLKHFNKITTQVHIDGLAENRSPEQSKEYAFNVKSPMLTIKYMISKFNKWLNTAFIYFLFLFLFWASNIDFLLLNEKLFLKTFYIK